MIDIPSILRVKIARLTSQIRRCVLTEQMAEEWEVTPGAISQAERHGYGEIKKIAATIIMLQVAAGRSCTRQQSDEAIRELVNLICEVAEYRAYRPIESENSLEGILEAAENTLFDSATVIGEIQLSISEVGDLGRAISDSERERIRAACDRAIEHLAALREYASEVAR